MKSLEIKNRCPRCKEDVIGIHSYYETKGGDRRRLFECQLCEKTFSETRGSFLFGLKTPVSKIAMVLRSLNEGLGINAVCRTFEMKKTTLERWQSLFSELYQVLYLYSLCHQFLSQVIEGDELYTKVKKTPKRGKVKGGRLF